MKTMAILPFKSNTLNITPQRPKGMRNHTYNKCVFLRNPMKNTHGILSPAFLKLRSALNRNRVSVLKGSVHKETPCFSFAFPVGVSFRQKPESS